MRIEDVPEYRLWQISADLQDGSAADNFDDSDTSNTDEELPSLSDMPAWRAYWAEQQEVWRSPVPF
jgi:hypothetical protein